MRRRILMLCLALFALGCGEVTLATEQGTTGVVTIDSKSVYWVSQDPGVVARVAQSGGTPLTLVSQPSDEGTPKPTGIAVDNGTVYWATDDGKLRKVGVGGGSVVTLATTDGQGGGGIVVEGGFVYWAPSDAILKVPVDGGAATTFLGEQPAFNSLVLCGSRLCWSTVGSGTDQSILSMPLSGGTPTTVAAGLPDQAILASDGVNVYWATWPGPGDIAKAPITGGEITTLATARESPQAIAVDSKAVYWTEQTAGLLKVSLDGGDVKTLSSGGGSLGAQIAVDATSVYWLAIVGGAGSILKTPK